jgi:epoxide hydrolase-like predicted phosphatase
MKKPIKAVIFDMGGVILRSVDPVPRDSMAKKYGTSRKELEEYIFHGPTSVESEKGLISDICHWESILKHFGQSGADPLAEYNYYFSGDAVDQKLLDYAKSLKPNIKIGLLSNAWVDSRKRLGRLFNFIDAFDAVIFSSEVETRKPDKEIYQIMLEKLEVKPQEAIFIDDFPENVKGASALGINAILFKDTQDIIHRINSLLGRE